MSGVRLSGVVDQQQQVAEVFGCDPRTVRRWADKGMPVLPDGRFDLAAIHGWRESTRRRDSTRGGLRERDQGEAPAAEPQEAPPAPPPGRNQPAIPGSGTTDATALRQQLLQADLDFKSAKAEREKLAVRKASEGLVDQGEMEMFLGEFFAEVRRGAQRIPLDMQVGRPKEFIDELRERLNMYLKGLQAWVENHPGVELVN